MERHRNLFVFGLSVFLVVSALLVWSMTSASSSLLAHSATSSSSPAHSASLTRPEAQPSTDFKSISYPHFALPAAGSTSEIVDTFSEYKDRSSCHVSSLDLHLPFSPQCGDRASVLKAMSYGGRAGQDAPYIPRGCDMRWYSTEEVCNILSRFEQVVLVGDSLMRHIANALWILIRADLGYGAINQKQAGNEVLHAGWFRGHSLKECRCHGQFEHKSCSLLLFNDTAQAVEETPDTLICKPGTFDLLFRDGGEYELLPELLVNFTAQMPRKKPTKPVAFIINHCLHDDANLNVTQAYMDSTSQHLQATIPWLGDDDADLYMPKLFVSSSVGDWKKGLKRVNQTVRALSIFEQGVEPMVRAKGYEFLGMYNMSLQATSFDGTHLKLESNLLKAMMVLNWLDRLELP